MKNENVFEHAIREIKNTKESASIFNKYYRSDDSCSLHPLCDTYTHARSHTRKGVLLSEAFLNK